MFNPLMISNVPFNERFSSLIFSVIFVLLKNLNRVVIIEQCLVEITIPFVISRIITSYRSGWIVNCSILECISEYQL